MQFTLTSLIRLIAFGAAALTAIAVGVSRAVPEPSLLKAEVSPRYYGVNGITFEPPLTKNFVLDAQEGRLVALEPVGGTTIDFASGSPWRDERGESELIGRATTSIGRGTSTLCEGIGLSLISLSGRVLSDQLQMDLVMTGRPCWLPGRSSTVLFPVGDGELRTMNLTRNPADPHAASPLPVVWACPLPGGSVPILNDPFAPVIPALDGKIVVSLSTRQHIPGKPAFKTMEIWWLELGSDGRTIRSVGRLTDPAVSSESERLPNLSRTPDGRIVLTYLSRPEGENEWRLRLAPVTLDPRTGTPRVVPGSTIELETGLAVNPPAFSNDATTLYAVLKAHNGSPTVCEFSVIDALSATEAPKMAD